MNDEELDRLFRQKLEPLEVQPSEQAWQELAQGLQHKKQKRVWAYVSGIAAATLLLLGTWGAMEYSHRLIPAEQLANTGHSKEEKTPEQAAEKQQAQQQAPEAQVPTEESRQTAEVAKTNPEPAAPAPARQHQKPVPQATEEQPAIIAVQKQPEEKLTPLPEPKHPEVLALETAATLEEKLPLVVEEVVISYQAEREEAIAFNQPDVEEDKNKKDISAKKIFGFLKKVTDQSGAGLAELREAKNELLSLNRIGMNESGNPE